MAFIPQVFPPTPCAYLSSPPYAPHAPPISFFSILPPAQYWVRNTDHSAPHNVTMYATNRKVAGSNPDRVTGFFH
jgi:hypothetical protein